ncbi:MAG: class I SAM-dependent methyltransferase [Bacteroidota bacterium]
MNKAYLQAYYRLEREHWWFVVRGKIIRDRVQSWAAQGKPDPKILNVGAATGKTSELLEAFGEVTSIEYDEGCVAFVRKTLNIPIIQASILDLPYADQTFDLVCAFDVIEHVENDQRAAAELHRVCKPGGAILVTVPAFNQLWSHHDVVNQHFRRYTRKTLQKLWVASDFERSNTTYFNTFLFPPIWLFRRISRFIPAQWIRREAGSDFSVPGSRGWITRIFYLVFSLERLCLSYISFPFGVSLMWMGKTNSRKINNYE